MLDFESSPQRKWIGTGILLIAFSTFFAYKAMETCVIGDLIFRYAKISVLEPVRSPVIVFEAGIHTTGCKISRCVYPHWREDVGKIAKIGLDERSMVSSIMIDGYERLSPVEMKGRSRNAWIICALLLIIGGAMCAHGIAINKRTQGD